MTTTPTEAILAGALNDNNPFVEAISYTPSGGVAKTINAAVNRESGMLKRESIRDRPQYKAEIFISSDATSGIATVTPRKDTVEMDSPELSDGTHTFNVAAIIGRSAMGWHLGLSQ